MRRCMLVVPILITAALALVQFSAECGAADVAADPNLGRLFYHDGITVERLWDAETETWYVPVRSKRLGELEEEAEESEPVEVEVEDDEDEYEEEAEEVFFVAIVDSGVLADHPVLQGRIAARKDFTGEGLGDRTGHGTYVALTLAQATPPEMKLMIAKVAGADGTVRKEALIDGLRWAAENGASIAYVYAGFVGDERTHYDLCHAIEELHDLTIFAAAGTLGPDADVCPAHCGHSHNVIPIGCAGPDGRPLPSSGRAVIYGRCDLRLEPLAKDR